MAPRSRILLIDSYDSFTFNLASLCKRAIPNCDIHILKNDALQRSSFLPLLRHFDAVIVGPGPGSPDNPADVGIVKDIWHVADDLLLPVFGVCLGLQSLAVEYGAIVRRLDVVKHGQISLIRHGGTDLFQDVGEVHAVRYHSLHIKLTGQHVLEPLAWANDDGENGEVLMALKHRYKPFWAVQYHPESVCTAGGGVDVLRNFWRLATQWSAVHGRRTLPWTAAVEELIGPCWPAVRRKAVAGERTQQTTVPVDTRTLHMIDVNVSHICELLGVEDDAKDFVLLDSAAAPGRFSIIGCLIPTSPRLTYTLGDPFVRMRREEDVSFVELGSHDIWAWLTAFMRRRKAHGGVREVPFWGGLVGYLSYELGVHTLTPVQPRAGARSRHPDVNLVFVERSIVVDSQGGTIYVQSILPRDGEWLDEMVTRLTSLTARAPDSVCPADGDQRACGSIPPPMVTLPDRAEYISKIVTAKEWLFSGDSYELCITAPTRVRAAKAPSAVARGTSSSWELYKRLRSRNPAPHSAYLRLHPSTLLSSSPERFLSYSRSPENLCQLRPIKGTVRKAPGITRDVAEQLLAGSKKEVAENLMIVDLIRHDLHSVVGEDVHVRQFCGVEEYKTLWQLVSVIEGKPAPLVKNQSHSDLGWEVLRASLPPGMLDQIWSMTGAPKKRSVEILRDLEGGERGIYSGVLGYADVGGGGDWAVTIRSCFKHDEQSFNASESRSSDASDGPLDGSSEDRATGDVSGSTSVESLNEFTERMSALSGGPHQRANGDQNSLFDEWTLGAGGAITALSDPVAEWEEMIVKVESVLRAFDDPQSR
ncbi:para-aminobenzoic acid synthetase [Pilatotrama ljubarskyi]|nr:para-aminobenzoic acid synthetase [Pilatotrama ljubarskyi]